MKRLTLALTMVAALLGLVACKKQATDSEAIRAGILQHLAAIGTLNVAAMDMDVRSISVNGSQARAEVEFRPKGSGAPGAGMQVAYNLEKRDGAWVVLNSQTLGGMQHPAPDQSPQANQNPHSGGLPNFHDVLNPSGAPAQGSLPPGHPPVNSAPGSQQPSAKNQNSPGKTN